MAQTLITEDQPKREPSLPELLEALYAWTNDREELIKLGLAMASDLVSPIDKATFRQALPLAQQRESRTAQRLVFLAHDYEPKMREALEAAKEQLQFRRMIETTGAEPPATDGRNRFDRLEL